MMLRKYEKPIDLNRKCRTSSRGAEGVSEEETRIRRRSAVSLLRICQPRRGTTMRTVLLLIG